MVAVAFLRDGKKGSLNLSKSFRILFSLLLMSDTHLFLVEKTNSKPQPSGPTSR